MAEASLVVEGMFGVFDSIFTFREISLLNGTSTDKAGELAYDAAVDRLAAQLIEDEVIRIVDLKLKKVVRRKMKNAAATYLYQAVCAGEWGEIHFDFENKRIKIRKLADWDTTKSHKYAWKVIGFIALKGNTMLPEKKRIILWDKNIGQRKKILRLKDGSVIYIPLHR